MKPVEINYNKHIWEGWSVKDFVDSLKINFDMRLKHKSFKSLTELKKWCSENQPYYKKHILEVFEHYKNLWLKYDKMS